METCIGDVNAYILAKSLFSLFSSKPERYFNLFSSSNENPDRCRGTPGRVLPDQHKLLKAIKPQ